MTLCRELYAARSEASHGAPIRLLAPRKGDEGEEASTATSGLPAAVLPKVARLQTLLRATIRRVIEEPGFAATFESEESIRGARWPVVITFRSALVRTK